MTATVIAPSKSLDVRQFTVTGTLVAAPWQTEPATLTVTSTHWLRAIQIAEEDARSAGLLLIDTRATVIPVDTPLTQDPTATEQGEEVAR